LGWHGHRKRGDKNEINAKQTVSKGESLQVQAFKGRARTPKSFIQNFLFDTYNYRQKRGVTPKWGQAEKEK